MAGLLMTIPCAPDSAPQSKMSTSESRNMGSHMAPLARMKGQSPRCFTLAIADTGDRPRASAVKSAPHPSPPTITRRAKSRHENDEPDGGDAPGI